MNNYKTNSISHQAEKNLHMFASNSINYRRRRRHIDEHLFRCWSFSFSFFSICCCSNKRSSSKYYARRRKSLSSSFYQ